MKKSKECRCSKTLIFIFFLKWRGIYKKKKSQWRVNVMYITKYKKYIIEKKK